jgi:hypothetical protein
MKSSSYYIISVFLLLQASLYSLLSLGSTIDFLTFVFTGEASDLSSLSILAVLYDPGIANITSLWSTILAFFAMLTFITLAYLYEFGSDLGRTWLILAIGIGLWTIGEFLWFFFVYTEGEAPYPSIADAAWIIGYPVLVFGLIFLNRHISLEVPNRSKIIFSVILFIIGIFILFTLGTSLFENDFIEATIGIFYPLGDLFVLLFAGLIVLKFSGGAEIRKSYFILVLAFILTSIGDILYSFNELIYGIYGAYAFDIADAFFIWGYTLLIVGALTYYHLVNKLTSN